MANQRLRSIQRIWKKRPKPLKQLLQWATRPSKVPKPQRPKERMKRLRTVRNWMGRKARNAQRWEARQAWRIRRRRYGKRYRAQRRRVEAGKAPTFEPWMANGRPHSELNARLKSAIAVGVVQFGLYVTSTKRSWGTTSWHEVWKAIDVAAAMTSEGIERMKRFQAWLAENRGPNSLEVFGPDSYYWKNGQRVSGAFPNHGDHDHYASH